MNGKFISVGDYYPNAKAYEYIAEIMHSGQLTYGQFSRRFEQEFSSLHSCRYGILSNSGTSSLHVALQALKEIHGWDDNDEVILPATTFVATANIVVHCKLKPVFVDVDKLSYNISVPQVIDSISDKTRAIIPVHMFGQPADMTYLFARLGEYRSRGVKIIEDSCETMFATHESQAVGSWGDIGCFSLYAAHILVGGVGGIATTNNKEYAIKMRSLVNHGLTVDSMNLDENCSPQPVSNRFFSFNSHGHSFRITEFEAAIALSQLNEWRSIVRARRRNARHLSSRLSGQDWLVTPYTYPENTHSYMMYPILIRRGNRESLIKYLGENKIQTRDMPSVIGNHFAIDRRRFPVSYDLKNNGLYVGCHQRLTIDDMDYVADRLIEYGKTRA